MSLRLLCLAFGLAAPSAAAQSIDCTTTSIQQEMNWCAEQDWQAADARLNAAYADAMAVAKDLDLSLPDDLKGAAASLKSAQRAWIPFRDAACAAEGYAMRGGSAEALLVYGCLARLTAQRADDLEMMAMTGDY